MLLGFPEYGPQATRLAERLGLRHATVDVHRFPDGESRVTLPAALPEHVLVCRSLDRPNDKLIELLLTAEAALELGARHLTLVAPYLCYMRQDIAFHPGEAVSQYIVGRFLARCFEVVVTVDPHLHRTAQLSDAVPAQRSAALRAAQAAGAFLRSRPRDTLLLGPDRESEQWVAAAAAAAGLPYGVCAKTRSGDREVRIEPPAIDLAGRPVVLVDDIASSGATLAVAAQACRKRGAAQVSAFVTHAVFAHGAEPRMRDAGIEEIWSSDSVPHATNAVPLAPVLADGLERLGV
ncbi:MAG TPA: ribose-phosphate diphosphokinase [Burkholderiales bacterium]|nr:ribose-phosphate diphosphokinase [Burkholderiales bacterium]